MKIGIVLVLLLNLIICNACVSNLSQKYKDKLLNTDSTIVSIKLKKDERCVFNYCDIYFSHKELYFSNSGNRDSVFKKKIMLDMPTAFNYGFAAMNDSNKIVFKEYYYLIYPGDSLEFSLDSGRYLAIDLRHNSRILNDPDFTYNPGFDNSLKENKTPKSDKEWLNNFTMYYSKLKVKQENQDKRIDRFKNNNDTNSNLIKLHSEILFYKNLFDYIYKEKKFNKVIISRYTPFINKAEAIFNNPQVFLSQNLLTLFYGILRIRLMEKNIDFTDFSLLYKEAQKGDFGLLKPGLLTSFLVLVPKNSPLHKIIYNDIQSRYSGTRYSMHISELIVEEQTISKIPLKDSLIQFNKTIITFDSLLKSKKDKFILIDFWASWCAPCRAQFSILDSIKPYFKNLPIEFVSLNIDKEERDWILTSGVEAKYLQQNNYHLSFNKGAGLIRKFGITSIPRYMLFRNGNVISEQFTTASEPGFTEELKKIIMNSQ